MLLNKRLDRISISTNNVSFYEILRLNIVKQIYLFI